MGKTKTDYEIMECLQTTAKDKGIKLTYTHELFFLRLLEYGKTEGVKCPEGIKVVLSVNEMSERLSISQRMVVSSLRTLSSCGAILRQRDIKTFPQSKSATILKNIFYENYERTEVK